ncbi:MAG: hypothetical protein ACK4EX_03340 [Thermaurantimonas sp.]|uniref:hypothetical protein n=1 Tax=Thermaurantimonas sp. TaxID=2681568 RepID=UPI00391B45FF
MIFRIFRNLLLIFSISIYHLTAQPNLKYWTSGVYISSQIHSGFASSGNYTFSPSLGFGGSLKNSFFNRIHLGIDAGYIHLKNAYKRAENNTWDISISNIEILPNAELHLRSFGKYMRKNKTSPYIKVAPSLNIFQSKLDNVQNFTNDFEFYPYSYLSIGWYIGVGYKIRLKNDYVLQLELFSNSMMTNKASGFSVFDTYIQDRYLGFRASYSFIKF